MIIEVSVGEAIDKLNILEIKLEKILDEMKKEEIRKEINALEKCKEFIFKYPDFYKWLTIVNTTIWELTDDIKKMDVNDNNFAIISNRIFEFNQKRFRIKSFFNNVTNSNIKEQKSYLNSGCAISVSSIDTIYDKISEINYLSLEYDYIIFDIQFESQIKILFDQPNIIFKNSLTHSIVLENYTIKDVEKYDKIPITYISGGLLGDLIQNMSVICENFFKTGKKGILYISETLRGDTFRYGLTETYNDTYEVISQQIYIHSFKIHNGETIDVNLNIWRNSPLIYNKNWYSIYKSVYDVEWGLHKWLTVKKNEWNGKVIINTTSRRFPSLDFKKIYEDNKGNIIFLCFDISEYEYFKERVTFYIPCYEAKSFAEMCIIINSCKLFIGSLSAPLSIAHALNKKRIACQNINCCDDNIMIKGLDTYWENLEII
jgi:hypothetical protein